MKISKLSEHSKMVTSKRRRFLISAVMESLTKDKGMRNLKRVDKRLAPTVMPRILNSNPPVANTMGIRIR
jgi:hypothetical protein